MGKRVKAENRSKTGDGPNEYHRQEGAQNDRPCPEDRRKHEVQIYSTPSRGEVAGAARLQSPRRQKTRVGGGDDNRVEKGGLVTLEWEPNAVIMTKRDTEEKRSGGRGRPNIRAL
jgi:hypothetical protein